MSKSFRRQKRIAISDLRNVVGGDPVKIAGRIVSHRGKALTAPFTGRICIYYEVLVHVNATGPMVPIVAREKKWVDCFWIKENDDFALVRTSSAHGCNARSILDLGRDFSHGEFSEDSNWMKILRQIQNDSNAIPWKHAKYTFREGAICLDATVAVQGRCVWQSVEGAIPGRVPYREPSAAVTILAEDEEEILVASDAKYL